MVSSMRIGRNVTYRILDIDWCTSDKVVLASDDGCIRVLEMAMKSASYRMDEQDLTGEPVNREREWMKDQLHITYIDRNELNGSHVLFKINNYPVIDYTMIQYVMTAI